MVVGISFQMEDIGKSFFNLGMYTNHVLLKGLIMVARALWRSQACRVVPWSETLHEP